jgi:hypothetical protein
MRRFACYRTDTCDAHYLYTYYVRDFKVRSLLYFTNRDTTEAKNHTQYTKATMSATTDPKEETPLNVNGHFENSERLETNNDKKVKSAGKGGLNVKKSCHSLLNKLSSTQYIDSFAPSCAQGNSHHGMFGSIHCYFSTNRSRSQ